MTTTLKETRGSSVEEYADLEFVASPEIPTSLTSNPSKRVYVFFAPTMSASVTSDDFYWNNATDTRPQNTALLEKIDAIFALAEGEFFEDGVETEFSRRLAELLQSPDNEVIKALLDYFGSYYNKPDAISEALRWIGLVNNPRTHQARIWLLSRCLTFGSSRIRDGANLGLAFMDDPSAIPYLEKAILKENVDQLRKEMKQVLEQLKETQQESGS